MYLCWNKLRVTCPVNEACSWLIMLSFIHLKVHIPYSCIVHFSHKSCLLPLAVNAWWLRNICFDITESHPFVAVFFVWFLKFCLLYRTCLSSVFVQGSSCLQFLCLCCPIIIPFFICVLLLTSSFHRFLFQSIIITIVVLH